MTGSMLKADGVFQWYEPSVGWNDSQQVAGTLEIAENGLSKLALVGLLPDSGSVDIYFSSPKIDQNRWIVGVLKDSSCVFLRRLDHGGTTFGRALSHQEIRARDCVVFQHLVDFPDLDAVSKLLINLDFLGNWASEPAIKVTNTSRGAACRASKPKVHTFKLPDKTLRLRTEIRCTASSDLCRSSTIKQETFLESEPKARQTLEAVRQDFHLMEDLFLMLSDVDVALPWPTVRYEKEAGTYYFERRRTNPQKVETPKSWAAIAGLGDSFGQLLANLAVQQDILGPGLYLYLGVRRGAGLYLENQFSTAIFGLESLHRRVGNKLVQVNLEAKIARIIGDINLPRDKEWLSGRLRNAGEPSLEERLFHTFSELEIGLDAKALRAFAKECADVRNQVAHFGGQRGGGYDAFVQRMFILNEAVRPLYHAVLLGRISFDPDRIRRYFHTSPFSNMRKRMMKAAGLTFVQTDSAATANEFAVPAEAKQ